MTRWFLPVPLAATMTGTGGHNAMRSAKTRMKIVIFGSVVLLALYAYLLPSGVPTDYLLTRKDLYAQTHWRPGSKRSTDVVNSSATMVMKPGSSLRQRRNIPDALYHLAREAFDVIPQQFLQSYKNPCFLLDPEVPTSFRCLPYFYLIGIQKCGTTDVWDKLTSHPDILRTQKEPHFWARYRVLHNVSIHTYLRGRSERLTTAYIRGDASTLHELISGDGSTSALADNRWQNMTSDPYDGPAYLVADIMREIQPDSKHIIVLRDPVPRTYSDYLFFNVFPPIYGLRSSPETFHRYVSDDIGRFNNCTLHRSKRACAYIHGKGGVRTLFGYYAIYIRDWLQRFPRDQLYILRTEDWYSNCTFYLRDIHHFLGLRELPEAKLQETCNQTKKLMNWKTRVVGPMLAETEKLLRDFFRDKNRELCELLDDERFLWQQEEIPP
ncbi:carbohydrate sulfotransferase 15-like isoform X2 [Diadema setosum]|uniref:carbohydrate sulfotransferase 15-like isoform X2 n=1 Tax=Diadema setosum TaxID=31175 RepID=UPI003B3B58BA